MAYFWFITPTTSNSTFTTTTTLTGTALTSTTTTIERRKASGGIVSSSLPKLVTSTEPETRASGNNKLGCFPSGSKSVSRTTVSAGSCLGGLKRYNNTTATFLLLLGTSVVSLFARQRGIGSSITTTGSLISTTFSTMSDSTVSGGGGDHPSTQSTGCGIGGGDVGVGEGGSTGIVNNNSAPSSKPFTAEAFTLHPKYPSRNNNTNKGTTGGTVITGNSGRGVGGGGSSDGSSLSTSSAVSPSFGIRRITSKDGSKTMKALASTTTESSSPEDEEAEAKEAPTFGGGKFSSASNEGRGTGTSPGIRKITRRGYQTSTSLKAGSEGGSTDTETIVQSDSNKVTKTETLSNPSSSTVKVKTMPLPKGVDESHPLYQIYKHLHPSWIEQLSSEEDATTNDNKSMRQVKNGHYVLVEPTPLRNPRLIAYSKELAIDELGLKEDDVRSDSFVRFFSGDLNVSTMAGKDGDTATNGSSSTSTDTSATPSWSTPYALSIMGKRYYNNCPFGNGNGYGDGRAISIAEVEIPSSIINEKGKCNGTSSNKRYEFQLKGAGPTPFCRGADGRAVLRSSIREFLASEAMYHLGISTTRALSLIVSDGPDGNTSSRPWYSEQLDGRGPPQLPSLDDPRLAVYPLEKRKLFIQQLARQKRDPDIMIEEPSAITCRVAPSFARIGHVDLFARRVANVSGRTYKTNESLHSSREYRELVQMIWHVAYREFYEEAYLPYRDTDDLEKCIDVILKLSSERIADMIAGWLRVGFAQGNFNADNCLIGGRTMDYGPFGFMDEYQPLFAKWTGSGDHFGFLNQPTAGYVNFMVLIESMYQALKEADDKGGKHLRDIERKESDAMSYGRKQFETKVREMWRTKLGFHPRDESASDVWTALEPLLRRQSTDWTLFWRQLTRVAKEYPIRPNNDISTDYEAMSNTLIGDSVDNDDESPFYDSLDLEGYKKFQKWIQQWRETLVKGVLEGEYDYSGTSSSKSDASWPEERMVRANPKYILREWMLVEAYSLAAKGDDSMVLELQQLTLDPYGEGTPEQHKKYYRRAPSESLTTGGTAFMT